MFGEHGRERLAEEADIGVRIILSRAIETKRRIMFETVIGRPERGVLAGEDDSRDDSKRCQRSRDRFDLDGFGTGADDENYATGQLSPWLGRGRVALDAPRLNENCRRRPGA
jgi:hypothetical protein